MTFTKSTFDKAAVAALMVIVAGVVGALFVGCDEERTMCDCTMPSIQMYVTEQTCPRALNSEELFDNVYAEVHFYAEAWNREVVFQYLWPGPLTVSLPVGSYSVTLKSGRGAREIVFDQKVVVYENGAWHVTREPENRVAPCMTLDYDTLRIMNEAASLTPELVTITMTYVMDSSISSENVEREVLLYYGDASGRQINTGRAMEAWRKETDTVMSVAYDVPLYSWCFQCDVLQRCFQVSRLHPHPFPFPTDLQRKDRPSCQYH